MTGPLAGLRVVELAAVGPSPQAAMVLADLGAEVVRVDRPAGARGLELGDQGMTDPALRGRRSVTLDLKSDAGREGVLALVEGADILLEGLRPGVLERLGLGPQECLQRNPALIYGRMTGWGQDGPFARAAGHDINYIAVTGALQAMGRRDQPPSPPLNLVGDFGGGSMLLLLGLLAALYERNTSGRGQVVDAAMVDGTVLNSHPIMALRAIGAWQNERESNLVDGGTPFYGTYACSDGKYVAVGALEPQFYAVLLEGLGIAPDEFAPQMDRSGWPAMRQRFIDVFARRTRDEWAEHFEGTDACVTPVLDWDEAARHPHVVARGSWIEQDGVLQSAPAPRFSRTPGSPGNAVPEVVELEDQVARWAR
ncbi:CaiB/BaiF CoA-transferase family protein [Nocardioides sp. AE5]|uniref:CaiB/BaiF CoA transferase family protein n=1 Tax=Nocardioides sp. AE5 TaxID=2962573 RepID=UPI002880F77C|nr:CaiB/BaiF CoA-transferase family protein [Nocardioides sp. AE5]MDT0202726.1 CaiB/BaiF CoA-transferase family protein [Nocardioides sp. AE5]